MSSSGKKYGLSREQEQLAARYFGRHVTGVKAAALLAVALIMCLSPILMGLRLWDSIPEIISTGLTDMAGNDDPLPRWALVCALPGLAAVLTLICHGQLWLNQRRQTVPKASVRLLGRWVIPVVTLFFNSWAISSCGGAAVGPGFVLPCAVGAALALLGGRLFDCERGSSLGLNFGYALHSEDAWRNIHRAAGYCSMAAGLLIILSLELLGRLPAYIAAAAALALVSPVIYCALRR